MFQKRSRASATQDFLLSALLDLQTNTLHWFLACRQCVLKLHVYAWPSALAMCAKRAAMRACARQSVFGVFQAVLAAHVRALQYELMVHVFANYMA